MEKQCFFNWKYDCGDKGDLTKAGPDRIRTIVMFSKEYKDNIHVDLVDKLGRNPELTIDCHRSCVSTHTSQQHLNRYKKRRQHFSKSAVEKTMPLRCISI
jgi:hypothetical protein